MKRAQKIVLTVIGIAALSALLPACALEEDDVDQVTKVDGPAPATYGAKVTICHLTHSRTTPDQVIQVAPAALPAHLAHGDFVGDSCTPPPPAIDAAPP